MGDVTLGTIKSEPNKDGEHTLKCPRCSHTFLSAIRKDDKTGVLSDLICPACHFSEEPKHFVAAAHQSEVNDLATAYVANELKNKLGNLLK
jgi:hypothetical protein